MLFFLTVHYICSYIQIFPKVCKLIKTKSSNDYSLLQLGLSYLGTICWTIYAFTTPQSTILYIGTVIESSLITLVNILILIYYKFKK